MDHRQLLCKVDKTLRNKSGSRAAPCRLSTAQENFLTRCCQGPDAPSTGEEKTNHQIFADSSEEIATLPRICQSVEARNEYGCGSSQEPVESVAFLNEQWFHESGRELWLQQKILATQPT